MYLHKDHGTLSLCFNFEGDWTWAGLINVKKVPKEDVFGPFLTTWPPGLGYKVIFEILNPSVTLRHVWGILLPNLLMTQFILLNRLSAKLRKGWIFGISGEKVFFCDRIKWRHNFLGFFERGEVSPYKPSQNCFKFDADTKANFRITALKKWKKTGFKKYLEIRTQFSKCSKVATWQHYLILLF